MRKLKALAWVYWVVGIDLFFILCTTINPYLPSGIQNKLVHHFDLGIEMNLGAWWSCINLLALALLSYELFSLNRERSRFTWLILAVIYSGLSLDEIGSFHERISDQTSIFPFIAFGGLILLVALGVLFLRRETRVSAVIILVGFGLFGLVAFQEKLEHIIHWPEWALGIRVGAEEGTELASEFLVFWTLIRLRGKLKVSEGISTVLADPFQLKSLPAVLIVSLVFHALFSWIDSSRFTGDGRGHPAVWIPLALFFILFCVGIWNYYNSRGNPIAWLVLAIYFLLSSAAVVYLLVPRSESSHVTGLGLIANFYLLYVLQSFLIVGLYGWAVGKITRRVWLSASFIVLVLVAGFFIPGLAIRYFIGGVFALWAAGLFLFSGLPVPVSGRRSKRGHESIPV